MAFGSEQWMYASGEDFYPYKIGQSARAKGASDLNFLKRTPTTGNNKLFTWSGWVKRSKLGAQQSIFVSGSGTNGVKTTAWYFNDNDQLEFKIYFINYQTEGLVTSDAVFRDTSAWYHLTLVYDSNNAVANDRLRAWVNGERIALSTPGFVKNYASSMNNPTYPIYMLGWQTNYAEGLKGYYAHIDYVDGQGLDPTNFGETKSGVWIPKEYEGTYGTNGCKLDFSNASDLGEDLSGNNNDFVVSDIVDQMLDSPTNNFATLNPLDNSLFTLSEGNLDVVNTNNGTAAATRGTIAASSGKWYVECCRVSWNVFEALGVCPTSSKLSQLGTNSGGNAVSFWDFDIYQNGSVVQTTPSRLSNSGDICGIALDLDNLTVQFYVNGSANGSAVSISSGEWVFSQGANSSGFAANTQTGWNFGQDSSFAGNKTAQGNTDANGIGDFYYAPPAGFLALCSANLPDPVIDPAEDDIPADYFNTVIYQGNNSMSRGVSGIGFQPDFTWIKSRTDVLWHGLTDSVRGGAKTLSSNSTNEETVNEVDGYLSSFDADGFTLTGGTNSNATFNRGTDSYASWNWKAGGTAVANTDGTIASQVSANTKAGFSIVTYTGNGTAGATVGHGLSSAPEMVISKNRDDVGDWPVYTKATGLNQKMYLNDTIASTYTSNYPSSPTASVMPFGGGVNVNGGGSQMVAYFFHSVEGFSKFGSYTGNGNADGPFVYTGFRPAYVMIKRTSDTGNWLVQNNKALGYNPSNSELYANLTNAEATADRTDFLSNGFKPRINSTENNASGSTYIYMAFAEMPFKYSLGR